MLDFTICPHCGQRNHPNHEVCWQCQTMLPLTFGPDGHRRAPSVPLEPISIEDWLDKGCTMIVPASAPKRPAPKPLPTSERYLRAVLLLIIATLVQMILSPLLLNHVPYAALSLAVLLTGWRYGFGPAVFCTILGAFVTDYFFLYPLLSFEISGPITLIHLVAYATSGFLTAILCARYHQLARQQTTGCRG